MQDLAEKYLAGLNAASDRAKKAIDRALEDFGAEIAELAISSTTEMDHRLRAFQGQNPVAVEAPAKPTIAISAPKPVVSRVDSLNDEEFRASLPRVLSRPS